MAKPSKKNLAPTVETIPTLEVSENNLSEVKLACKSVGLTLEKTLQVIKDAQSATRVTLDKFGGEHEEPDHDKRLRGALMHLELEGYTKNNKASVDNSKHTHVTVMWKDTKPTRLIDVD